MEIQYIISTVIGSFIGMMIVSIIDRKTRKKQEEKNFSEHVKEIIEMLENSKK